ncbi:hypothetical protein AVHY2522_07775 [Acidovorax sp. SUPP2522]|uniref:hypothetical protein n=1 Tax=unclassified Acidovorax TaxID=2684926 RepID=UPI00234AD260|nr:MULTISPECIES: hypothetical protein [unclassified Acidovorax]WCM96210.1 hypothetical protein M5C96_17430 [Acidovorax sp. GBBC 1281]GKT15334.1 hypothetical protein AVHY2522_07775 [Acidovorax sp. SUPP2522]
MTGNSPNVPPADATDAPGGAGGAWLESAAYPPAVRGLAVTIVVALGAFAAWSVPALRGAQWSFTSLATFCLAGVLIAWVGWWMVFSRTRFTGDALLQSWLWDKKVHIREVATFKIVHWPWLSGIVAPRMLVRRRNGSIAWVHSADPALLVAFGEAVVRQGSNPQASSEDQPPTTR